jgi:hypothetical protein
MFRQGKAEIHRHIGCRNWMRCGVRKAAASLLRGSCSCALPLRSGVHRFQNPKIIGNLVYSARAAGRSGVSRTSVSVTKWSGEACSHTSTSWPLMTVICTAANTQCYKWQNEMLCGLACDDQCDGARPTFSSRSSHEKLPNVFGGYAPNVCTADLKHGVSNLRPRLRSARSHLRNAGYGAKSAEPQPCIHRVITRDARRAASASLGLPLPTTANGCAARVRKSESAWRQCCSDGRRKASWRMWSATAAATASKHSFFCSCASSDQN